jgi:hypothetical protein
MANKYIDNPDFGLATAIYDDVNLTSKSADGVYQFDGETRVQLNGLLGPVSNCPSCIESNPIELCYDSSSEVEACCNCGEEEEASDCVRYQSIPYDSFLQISYLDCNGDAQLITRTCSSTICQGVEFCATEIISSSETLNQIGSCNPE